MGAILSLAFFTGFSEHQLRERERVHTESSLAVLAYAPDGSAYILRLRALRPNPSLGGADRLLVGSPLFSMCAAVYQPSVLGTGHLTHWGVASELSATFLQVVFET